MALNFDVHWIHGAENCQQTADPVLQTHAAEPTTFIFRQSKCTSFEAPFIYLLVGATRSLLLDTGAPMVGELPVRPAVDAILADHATGTRHQLVVAHSHAHADHASGDSQFSRRPDTVIVRQRLRDIRDRFGIDQWPNHYGSLELGGRTLTVIPIPGHDEQHIAIHDSKTGLVLTGDTFYPGRLVVNNWPAYRASARRLAAFTRSHTVTCLLGAHIEIRETGELFPIPCTFQPNEHPLQLFPADLFQWAEACDQLGDGASGEHAFPSFVIDIR